MPTQIILRHGLERDWIEVNPILAKGEMGIETDTKRFKIGDGYNLYTSLDHFKSSIEWDDILNKPLTFLPSVHVHSWDNITNKPTDFLPSAHVHSWDSIESKPTTFPPSSHGHGYTAISGMTPGFVPFADENGNLTELVDFTFDGLTLKSLFADFISVKVTGIDAEFPSLELGDDTDPLSQVDLIIRQLGSIRMDKGAIKLAEGYIELLDGYIATEGELLTRTHVQTPKILGISTSDTLEIFNRNNEGIVINDSGNVGMGLITPTAVLHLKSGIASASGAPLKLTVGTTLTTPEAGVVNHIGNTTNSTFIINPYVNGSAQVNTIVGAITKTDTGDPVNAYEGQMCINTFDNTLKVYADGRWCDIVAADAISAHESTYDHDLISTALQSESDPVFTSSHAASITESDITKLSNLSGTNTGDQDLSQYAIKSFAIAMAIAL